MPPVASSYWSSDWLTLKLPVRIENVDNLFRVGMRAEFARANVISRTRLVLLGDRMKDVWRAKALQSLKGPGPTGCDHKAAAVLCSPDLFAVTSNSLRCLCCTRNPSKLHSL